MRLRVIKEASSNRDLIVNKEGTLEIAVYHLVIEQLHQAPDLVYLFGDDHGDHLAFEIRKGNFDDESLADAITWYAAERLDHPGMEVLLDDPRPNHNRLFN
ncbi:hypothetical protein EOD41_10845 [Mucilaginibacter limnophilus]|uniref:Uncharacterized protein n=1 Tax=Mucilaginibacter limnophilus TaxID=1932778 RepID=A0A437MTY0_9SPHI|nr:hypothetical protein [Mucilaginibacter limnophilus]RVU01103.1 hypothetical protein EOD41_10845 [Mucilaginibacter limnophilus]